MDLLEASFENGKIASTATPAIDAHLAEGIEDIAQGRTHGPYASAAETISALERRVGRRSKNQSKRK